MKILFVSPLTSSTGIWERSIQHSLQRHDHECIAFDYRRVGISKRRRYLLLFLFVFFVSFAAYLKTMAPCIVTEGDSGEFITCIGIKGVPHEPGYGSFVLFSAALGVLAPGGLEWGLNLSSALTAALTVGLIAVLFLRLGATLFGATQRLPLPLYKGR